MDLLDKIKNECKQITKPPSNFYNERWYNMIKRSIEAFLQGECNRDLLVLTGPRRAGKTTILLKLVHDLNALGEKNVVCYINVEDFDVQRYLKDNSLKNLVFSLKDEADIFLVDEITSLHDNWAQQVKELWDYMVKEDLKKFLIITGSTGILISNNYSLISGRSGYCRSGRLTMNQPLIILPMKYSQYAEYHISLINNLNLQLMARNKREEAILNIARKETSTIKQLNQILRFNLNTKRINVELGVLLKSILELYLVSGGFPQILEESRKYNDIFIEIEDYLRNLSSIGVSIINSVYKDAELLKLREEHAREFIRAYAEVSNMSTIVDMAKLENRVKTNLGLSNKKTRDDFIQSLVNFFIDAHLFVKATPLAEIESPNHQKIRLFLNDPIHFWALYYSRIDVNTNYGTAEGHLLEHTVCSHIARLFDRQNLSFEFYNDGDIDIDCIFTLRGKKILVQVQRSEKEAIKDLERASEVIKRIGDNQDALKHSDVTTEYYPISVVKNFGGIKIVDQGVIVPAHLFLYLI